jgi:hypothetical protein
VLGDIELVSSPASLEAFLLRYRASAAPAVAAVQSESLPGLRALEPTLRAAAPHRSAGDRHMVHAAPPDSAASPGQMRTDDSVPSQMWRTRGRRLAAAAALLAMLGAGVTVAARRLWPERGRAAALGTLELSTRPSTVEAFIDGTRRGATPLIVALDPGVHTVELRGAGQPRRIQLTINPGMKVSQFVDLTSRQSGGRRAPARQR